MRSTRPGFTLIEVIIAVTIVAILAGVMLPRLGRLGKEQHELTLSKLEQLLAAFAYRESTGSMQVGLWREAGSADISLVVMDEQAAEGDERAAWRGDTLVPSVKIVAPAELLEVLVDGEPMDPTEFLVTSRPGSSRPTVAFVVSSEGKETTISLLPAALRARRDSDDRSGELADIRAPIDLDAEGRDQDPW